MPASSSLALVALLLGCSSEGDPAPEPSQEPPPAPAEAPAESTPPPPVPSTPGAAPPKSGPQTITGSAVSEAFAIAEAGHDSPDPSEAYRLARAQLQQAMDDAPDNATYHAAMGFMWANELTPARLEGESWAHNRQQALASFERALELDPHNVRAHEGLGHLLMEDETPESTARALELFSKALELDPSDHNARLRLAEAMVRLERYEDAEPLFEQLIEAHTEQGHSQRVIGTQEMLAQLYLARGETERAERLLLEAASTLDQLGPELPDFYGCTHQSLGALYHDLGEQEKALDAWRRLAELEPGNPQPLRDIVAACQQLGDESCTATYQARLDALEQP